MPTVTATTTDPNATKVITPAASLPGATTVVVTAENGTSTQTYTVNFTVQSSSNDATLSDLKVSGTTVSGFSPSVLAYNMVLPYGTSTVPTVTATTNHVSATKVITPAASLPGTTNIVVTAQDGTTTKTYTINFTVAKNNAATLSDLKVTGATVSGFSSSVLTYNVVLAYGTVAVPTVTATTTDTHATKIITPAASLPGITTVVVTAQDGTTAKTYSISFTVAKNTDASLSDIKVNGTSVSGFDKNTLNYTIALPHGSTEPPVITVTATDPNATTEVTLPIAYPGIATIKVTADDRSTLVFYLLAISYGGDGIDNNLIQKNLRVYPNPSHGDFMLEYNSVSTSRIKISILDITGRLVFDKMYDISGYQLSEQIHITDQKAGFYFIRLVDGMNVVYQKVIVE